MPIVSLVGFLAPQDMLHRVCACFCDGCGMMRPF